MKKEIRIFFTAILYFTRIPCPCWVDHSEEFLEACPKYLPLIGIVIGALSGGIYYLTHLLFDKPTGIFLAMIVSMMLTGAFHEDGLADMCDGFGGGWTKEKILAIMKDSRIGAFGAIGLMSVLGLKFLTLTRIESSLILPILISGNALSRWFSVLFLYTDTYARETGDSKSRPFSHKFKGITLLFSAIFGFAPLILLRDTKVLITLPILFLVWFVLARMFRKWIGGYTGDCLGGTQQITELVFYLSYTALWVV